MKINHPKIILNLFCLLLFVTVIGCNSENSSVSDSSTNPDNSSSVQDNAWKTIQGEGVSLSVPPNYEGGNPGKDIDTLTEKLIAIDPKYQQQMDAIKLYAASLPLLAFDLESAKTANLTGVNITRQKVPEGVTLDMFLERSSQELSQGAEVLEQGKIDHPQYEMGKLLAEASTGVENPNITLLAYVVPTPEEFWVITYTTTTDEFEQRRSNFEKSIQSFQIVPEES